MKRSIAFIAVVSTGLLGGFTAAQTQSQSAPPAGKQSAEAAPPTPQPQQSPGAGMQRGRRMGGGGMMGMGEMCPMMVGVDTKVEVKNLSNGVTITLTNANADTVKRLQKAAEGMRLMHEAHAR
jgi:hypothetical protein